MVIGETLRQIRRRKNLSQTTVCSKLKISQTYLSQVEAGKKEPAGRMFRRICKFYKVPYQIVVWQSLTEQDIPKAKRSLYQQLSPVINELVESVMK